jgi:predicted nucleic acid-binding protein
MGGRAALALRHPQLREVFTTEHTFAEVEEYVPVLAKKKGLPADVLILAVAALPVTIVERTPYAKKLPEALRRIGARDPDDVDLLALALHLQIPIWSNDRDFENTRVELLTTEDLLRHLRLIK